MLRRAEVASIACRRIRGLATVALLAVLSAPAPAGAQESTLLALEPEAPLPLGAAWDGLEGRSLDEAGACMAGTGAERSEGGPTTWTLVVLSRAGGRLLVGAHVARTIASEALAEARMPDAARRLAGRNREEFRALCGDAFVAARAIGGQYVGELELGPSQARVASARLRTGVWTEPGPFQAALEGLAALPGAQARELPDGRRNDARTIAPAALVERALAFPATVDEANAQPFLAMTRRYPESAFAGATVAIDPTQGWGDGARAVFLRDAGAGGVSSAAARAAEMRKAVVQRRPGDPRRPFGAPADVPVALAAPARDTSPPAAAPATPDTAAQPTVASEPVPAAIAAPAAPAPPVARRRMAALVYETALGSTPVFATTEAPPGVYAERVKQRVYWVPGVAAASPELRDALARAAASSPARGTTILVATVGAETVVLTDVAPVPGVAREPAGALTAWIAGVAEPSAAQREALAAAARGGS